MKHQDRIFLEQAIELARSGIGRTAPNPSVGCIITVDTATDLSTIPDSRLNLSKLFSKQDIIASARTGDGGVPHAEVAALSQAENRSEGATLYCSLEPCCHHGKTPPCVQAIIKNSIKRVVIGAIDPDPRVSGKGIECLRAGGVEVEVATNHLNDKAQFAIKGFISKISIGRPYTTLKLAMSLDGKIALSDGQSKWITSAEQRKKGHIMRSQNDAILVGIGTVLADDPMLNCRVEENRYDGNTSNQERLNQNDAPHKIVRVIIDTNLRLPLTSKICASTDRYLTIVFCCNRVDQLKEQHSLASHSREEYDAFIARRLILEKEGVLIEYCPLNCDMVEEWASCNGYKQQNFKTRIGLDLDHVVRTLANKYGINDLLVEGGSKIATSMIRDKLIDRIVCFQAPIILGNDAIAGIGDLGITDLNDAVMIDEIM